MGDVLNTTKGPKETERDITLAVSVPHYLQIYISPLLPLHMLLNGRSGNWFA